MAEYQLYCIAQSGNAYRAALMLNLIGAEWEPIWVDFFAGGATRKPDYRDNVNEMGEVPVLVHGKKKLTQSGVILTYLSDFTGKFKPQGEDGRLEALRWIILDNQKVNGYLGPYRFLRNFAKPAGDPAAAIWVILGKTRYKAELIQSSPQKGVETASWPSPSAYVTVRKEIARD